MTSSLVGDATTALNAYSGSSNERLADKAITGAEVLRATDRDKNKESRYDGVRSG